jgi:hypothetical protein
MKGDSAIGRDNMKEEKTREKSILDFPNLGEYLLVSDTIKKQGPITLAELVKKLEGKVRKGNTETIVDYMLARELVDVDGEGKITLKESKS